MAGIEPRFYYLTLGLLALCTVVGLIVAYQFQREVNDDLAPPTEKDLLGPLEKAYYSGLMREEEFKRIQDSMAKQKGEERASTSKTSKIRIKPRPIVEPAGTPDQATEPGSTEEMPPSITPTGDSDPGPAPG